MKTITILLFSFLMQNCDAQGAKSNLSNTMAEYKPNGDYTITAIGKEENALETLTINFDDSTKRVSGYTGCNRFFGTYTLKENKIDFGPIATTRKMCDEKANNIEASILKAFDKANKFTIDNNTLSLLKNRKVTLTATKTIISKKETIEATTDSTTTSKTKPSYSIEYTATSRSSYKKIKITKDQLTRQLSRSIDATVTVLDKKDWNTIIQLVKAIKTDSLTTLEAPSKGHQSDRSRLTKLTIFDGQNSYTTPTFDEGNPNKTIAALVNAVLKASTLKEETH